MSATLKNLLLFVVAVLALAGGYWAAQSLRPAEKVTTPTYGGGTMIDFTLPDLDGKKHALNEWRGKVIVLNFWATWCPPCREEIPLFISLQKKHPANDLQVIGVAIDTLTAVMVYRQSVRINYPILIGENDAMPLMTQYGNRMGSLPFTVIIDRSGSIAARKLGEFNQTDIESLIDPLLTRQ
ncbi:MAG: TlpA disulfide reductase family protein [Sulfuricaulis sp.]|uniref:TlpA family protein disulfide reductase n=1 Tax=Sulfuricaulis sp. TaxID=2003553 RepID=UPI003C433A46